MSESRSSAFGRAFAALAVLTGLTSAGAAGHAAESAFPMLLSEADEARIGAEQHEQILAEFGGAYRDPAISSYVDSIGQFLALTSERPNLTFTFTVLNSPIVNAFATPGGYVYVTRGLLALAGDEAELAGVMAHEIGHVVARHGAERIQGGVLANLGLGLLGLLTDNEQLAGLAQVGALAVLQSYSREQEYEADLLGVRYLSRAGFDPDAMGSFLAKLEAHSELEARAAGQAPGGARFDIMATHPRTAERVRRAVAAANARVVREPIVGRDIYLTKIDGLLYGDDPEQGLIRGRRFVHPQLGFAFEAPPDFAMLNGQRQVIGRGPQGALFVFDGAPRGTAPTMTAFLRDQWLPDADLEVVEPLRVNGRDAATAAFRASVDRQPYDVRAVAVAFDRRTVYRFLFLTPPAVTDRFDEAFRRTTYSLRAISAAEAAQARPKRLVLHRVAAGETQASLAERMAVESHALERFRILNGLAPGQPLAAGTRVKLVVE